MKLEISEVALPEIESALEPKRYEYLKKSLLAVLLAQRATVFDEQGGASGKWAPLSASRFRALAKKVESKGQARAEELAAKGMGGVRILQDTGILRQSFTADDGPGSSHRIELTDGDEVRIATNVEYAAIHNEGGTIMHPGTSNGFGRGVTIPAHTITIPARPFDEFSEEDKEEINLITEKIVNGEL